MSRPSAESIAPARRRAPGIAAAAGLSVLGAAAVAGGSVLTWWTAGWADPLSGPVTTSVTGADVVPELLPLALVALAGWAAAAAGRGLWRRVVGAVLALAGAWLAVRSVLGGLSAPDALARALVRPATAVGDPSRSLVGPALTVLGGLLLLGAGLLLAVRAASPSRRRVDAAAAGGPARRRDAGDTTDDWWKDLDAGADPTDRATDSPPEP